MPRGAGPYTPPVETKPAAAPVAPAEAPKDEGSKISGDVVKELESIQTAAEEVSRRIADLKTKLAKKK